jgi:hypothetical protein
MTVTQTAAVMGGDSGHLPRIGLFSLAVGPLLMSAGAFMHPAESVDAAPQAAIIADQPDRWYLAHILILVGFALFLPGLLLLAATVTARLPGTGRVPLLLILIGAFGLAAMVGIELLAGRLAVLDGAALESLLDARSSASVLIPLGAIAAGFFIGSIILTVRMIRGLPTLRWPAAAILIGVLLIAAEIVSAEVVFSRVGNVLVWVGAVSCAVRLRHNAD